MSKPAGRIVPSFTRSALIFAPDAGIRWLPTGTIKAPVPLNVAPASISPLFVTSRKLLPNATVLVDPIVRKRFTCTLIVESPPAATLIAPLMSVLSSACSVDAVRLIADVDPKLKPNPFAYTRLPPVALTDPPKGNVALSLTSSVLALLAARTPVFAAPSQSLSLAAVSKMSDWPTFEAPRRVLLITREVTVPKPEMPFVLATVMAPP